MLQPGVRYTFRATATASNVTGFGAVSVLVNTPPGGPNADCWVYSVDQTADAARASVSSYKALRSSLTVICADWVSQSTPLQYRVRLVEQNIFLSDFRFSNSLPGLLLGPGPADRNFTHSVEVSVRDSLGAIALFRFDLRVTPPDAAALAEAVNSLNASVAMAVANGDVSNLARQTAALLSPATGVFYDASTEAQVRKSLLTGAVQMTDVVLGIAGNGTLSSFAYNGRLVSLMQTVALITTSALDQTDQLDVALLVDNLVGFVVDGAIAVAEVQSSNTSGVVAVVVRQQQQASAHLQLVTSGVSVSSNVLDSLTSASTSQKRAAPSSEHRRVVAVSRMEERSARSGLRHSSVRLLTEGDKRAVAAHFNKGVTNMGFLLGSTQSVGAMSTVVADDRSGSLYLEAKADRAATAGSQASALRSESGSLVSLPER